MLARTAARRALSSRIAPPSRRLLTTAAAPKKRTWKGAAVRWGLAGAGLYYYNTNDIFAEQELAAIDRLEESIHHIQQSELPTIEAIVAEKRARAAARAAEELAKEEAEAAAVAIADAIDPLSETIEEEAGSAANADAEEAEGGPLEALEAEAGQEGAFNPETGEINWDCPCLGGMAHGPCGPEFREAFSCFVYSKEEPKGMECIEKFKGMQDCFRAHPEMYGSELEEDEAEIEAEINAQDAARAAAREDDAVVDEVTSPAPSATPQESHGPSSAPKETVAASAVPSQPLEGNESEELVAKVAHDAPAKEEKA